MIAKRIPAENEPTAGPKAVIAATFGLTAEEFNSAMMSFLENEGFDGDGNEFKNLYDWLTLPHNTRRDNTPFQKGDNYTDY